VPDAPAFTISSQKSMANPEDVATRSFPTARRGLDPDAVRRFLEEIATHLRELRAREAELRAQLAEAERRAAAPELDEQTLSAALGTETARVLQAAHEAAHEIVGNAQTRAAALVGDAEEAIAARSRASAEESDARLEAARAEAEATVERARIECQTMVDEAREARHRILSDLISRRRSLHTQLEQLRAGKDALATVVGAVASSIGAVQDRLTGAEEEARGAADDAAHVTSDLDDRSIEEIVAEALARALPAVTQVSADAAIPPGPTPTPQAEAVPVDEPIANLVIVESDVEAPSAPYDEEVVADLVVDGADEAESAPPAGALDELFARLRAEQSEVDVLDEEIFVVLAPDADNTAPEDNAAGEDPVADDGASAEAEPIIDIADVEVFEVDVTIVDVAAGEAPIDTDTDTDAVVEQAPTSGNEHAIDESAERADVEVVIDDDETGPETALDRLGLERRDALLTVPAAELSRALKRVLRVEQNELLDACRHLPTSTAVGDLFVLDGAAARVTQAASVSLTDAYQAGTAFLGDAAPSVRRGVVAQETEALARALGDEVVGAISRRLIEGLEASASEDLDPIGLTNAVFREWRGARIEAVAGDNATRAFAAGTLAGAREAGVPLRWIVDDGSVDCPDCDDNALAGAQAAGTAFPTGHIQSPVHSGCRCVLAPSS
jgi:DivIVA domain-containing protein